MHEPSPTDTVNKSLKVTENAVLTWWCPKICNAAVEIEVVKVHYRMRTGRSKFTEQHCHSQICSLCSVPGDATAAYHTNRQTSISILMKEKICGEAVGYLHQFEASHQFILSTSGVCKSAGAAVKPATNRTRTLHRIHNWNEINKCKRDEPSNVHWTRWRCRCGLHVISTCSSEAKTPVLSFRGTPAWIKLL